MTLEWVVASFFPLILLVVVLFSYCVVYCFSISMCIAICCCICFVSCYFVVVLGPDIFELGSFGNNLSICPPHTPLVWFHSVCCCLSCYFVVPLDSSLLSRGPDKPCIFHNYSRMKKRRTIVDASSQIPGSFTHGGLISFLWFLRVIWQFLMVTRSYVFILLGYEIVTVMSSHVVVFLLYTKRSFWRYDILFYPI